MVDAVADSGDNARWLSQWLLRTPELPLLTGSPMGRSGFNMVAGTDGADRLYAEHGKDNVLYGGEGRDTLFAGTGRDILYGDGPRSSAATEHRDTFVFESVDVLHKTMKKTDVIVDFDRLDRIDLSGLTGPKLEFIGKARFSDDGDGEVRFKAVKDKGYAVLQIKYVNPDIIDPVTQVNVKVLAEAPAMSMGNLYQTIAHSLIL